MKIEVSLDQLTDNIESFFNYAPIRKEQYSGKIDVSSEISTIRDIVFDNQNGNILNPGDTQILNFENCTFETNLEVLGSKQCQMISFKNCDFSNNLILKETLETNVVIDESYLGTNEGPKSLYIRENCHFVSVFNIKNKFDRINISNSNAKIELVSLLFSQLTIGSKSYSTLTDSTITDTKIASCTIDKIISESNVRHHISIYGGEFQEILINNEQCRFKSYYQPRSKIKLIKIRSTLQLLEIGNADIDELQLIQINERCNCHFVDITLKKLIIDNCFFSNTHFNNIDLRKAEVSVHRSSFSQAHFFNVQWNREKPLSSDNKQDSLEAFRTLKISYKNDDNTYYHQFFFARELKELLLSSKENYLSWEDKTILMFNRMTGFGVSFSQSTACLILYIIIFLTACNFYIGNDFIISWDALNEMLRIFAKGLNPISDFSKEPFYQELHPLIHIFHKIIIATFYYQIIISFRKFSRK